MKALFQKLAEVVNGPTVDWTKAQQSPVNGYVSPGEDLPYDDSPTKALPAPGEQVQPVRRRGLFRRRRNFVQENKPTATIPPKLNTSTIPPEEDTQNEDKDYFMPMTPGLAGTLNADLRDNTPPNWKSWPTPTWNPL